MAENSARKFSADSRNRRKQLPTKIFAGNTNPQEIPQKYLQIFLKAPNPQKSLPGDKKRRKILRKYLRIFLKTPNPQVILLSTKSASKSLGIPADFFPQQNPQKINKFLVVYVG
jgi:hypothetical protein